ncbi:MAG TPA: hypothetical protein V6C58_16435 [Allocoleopsis sp.]
MTKQNYENMTRKQIKEYLLSHRNDEEAWSVFFEQLGNLDNNQGYSPDLPSAEMEKIFQSKLNQKISHL